MMWKRAERAVVAALLLGWALATAIAAEAWVRDSWRRATYYRATFSAPQAAAAQLHIAAADSYAVYLNGAKVGSDTTWTRMGIFPVQVASGDNHVAVVTANRGRGAGHGLLVSLQADSLQVVSTTDRSLLTWRWTGTAPGGTGWLTAPPEEGWHPVQSGSLDTTRIATFAGGGAEVVAGFAGNVDVGGPERGVTLKPIRGENLALDRPANRVETVDGDLLTAWEPPVAALNFTASVDLRERFLVHGVRVLTKGPGYEDNSLRGYSVQVSDDQVRWSEVASMHDISDYVRTEATFAPTWTRFVRIVIIQINAVTQPRVAEIEVFGDGFTERGAYLSELLDLGRGAARKNFGRLDWDAETPDRTDLTVQVRTGDGEEDFADADAGWSAPLTHGGIPFPAGEPGRLLQFRVNMETRDERRTPIFRRLSLEYSDADLPVTRASSWAYPNEAPMGVDTTFTVTIDLVMGAGDLGVERLQISVPAEAAVDPADIEGTDVALASWQSTQDTLTLVFTDPLTSSGQLVVPLETRTYSNLHEFRAFVFSPGSDNPLNVRQDRGPDPLTGQARSWELVATSTQDRVLSQVRPTPAVLTPNGDGINDDTVIEFVLAKVDLARQVRVQIADLAGNPVADLSVGRLPSGSYRRSTNAGLQESSPGRWDGTDDAGELVPPGLYLYRIEVELDRGDEVAVGVVGVAY